MSDEIVAVVAPIAMYWITSCLYAILGRQEYRLHSTEEEEMKNLVPKREVIRVVLLQHLTQAAIAFAVFTVRLPSSMPATVVQYEICKNLLSRVVRFRSV
jgi:sphinganine C4-monooxygenase